MEGYQALLFSHQLCPRDMEAQLLPAASLHSNRHTLKARAHAAATITKKTSWIPKTHWRPGQSL